MNLESIGLCAYTEKKSYFSNDNINVFVNYEKNKEINWSIIDKYNKTFQKGKLITKPQLYYPNAFAEGCKWNKSISLKLNGTYSSDIYFIKLFDESNKQVWYCEFVIKNKSPKSKILVLNNMNTKEAYNYWGGLDGNISLYSWNTTNPSNNTTINKYKNYTSVRSNIVSFSRPSNVSKYINSWNFDLNKNFFQPTIIAEIYGLIWLDQNNYSYDLITDLDFDSNPKILDNYKTFVNFGHNEYWTINMVEGLRSYILNFGNFINLGGNSLYWKSTIKNNQLEVRKDFDIHTHDGTIGGLLKNLHFQLNTSVYDIMGAYYEGGLDKDNFYNYKITKKDHWIFKNINSSIIGTTNLNSKNGMKNIGASGFEVDCLKINKKYSLGNAVHTEKDNIINHLIYYENNGKVFNAGSIVFSGSLLTDKNLSLMTKNILNNFLSKNILDTNYKLNWADTYKLKSFKLKSENKIKSKSWISKNVNISNLSNYSLNITSTTSKSTPGIYCNLNVKPNSYYNLIVNGSKSSNNFIVVPYIISTNRDIIWKFNDCSNLVDAKNVQISTNNIPINLTIKIPNGISKIYLYLLFYKVSLNDKFNISSIFFNEVTSFNKLDDITKLKNEYKLTDWVKNQNVSISYSDKINVISNKNISTPGIKLNELISLKKNTIYEFKFNGYKRSNSYDVKPYIIEVNTKEKINLSSKYVILNKNKVLNTSNTDISIKFKTLDKDLNVIFYILFSKPSIGAEFVINSFSINEIEPSVNKQSNEIESVENYQSNELESLDNDILSFNKWVQNQSVNLQIKDNKLIVISNKNSSTPGIKFNEIFTLSKNEIYEYKIIGSKKSNDFRVLPYIFDTNSRNKLYPSKNLISATSKELDVSNTEISLKIKAPKDMNIRLYILFSKPYVGAEFTITSIEFTKLNNSELSFSYYKNKVQNNNFVAYTDKKSYYPNDIVNISSSINSKILKDDIKVISYSLIDINKNIISNKESQNLNYQKYPYLGCIYGCNWNISESINIPNNLKSGMYIICARYDNNVWFMPIVLKNKFKKTKILVLSNVNTWNAYEYWAGYRGDMISAYKWDTAYSNSFKYTENDKLKSYMISFDRPSFLISKEIKQFIDNDIRSHITYSHLVYSELWMYKFLDDNSIEYDLINDIDLNNNEGVNDNYKMLIIHSHPEYWTDNSLINLNKMTRNGTNIAYLGGNGFYWRTTYDGNKMEVRKDGTKHRHDKKKGGLWIDLELPENNLTGPELFGVWFNINKFDKITLYPFNKVKDNYLLEDIEKEFGEITLSSVRDDDGGISGWEVDDVKSTSNQKYKNNIIANAINGADMLYIEENNYKIFSASTILWTAGLLVDKSISKITLNLVKEFTK